MERKIIASFKIEKGIPIPPKMFGFIVRIPYPFLELEIGDSFWFKASLKGLNTANGSHNAIEARGKGRKFTSRHEDRNGVKGFRTWRIA